MGTCGRSITCGRSASFFDLHPLNKPEVFANAFARRLRCRRQPDRREDRRQHRAAARCAGDGRAASGPASVTLNAAGRVVLLRVGAHLVTDRIVRSDHQHRQLQDQQGEEAHRDRVERGGADGEG